MYLLRHGCAERGFETEGQIQASSQNVKDSLHSLAAAIRAAASHIRARQFYRLIPPVVCFSYGICTWGPFHRNPVPTPPKTDLKRDPVIPRDRVNRLFLGLLWLLPPTLGHASSTDAFLLHNNLRFSRSRLESAHGAHSTRQPCSHARRAGPETRSCNSTSSYCCYCA